VTTTEARTNRRVLPSVTDHGREDRGRVGNGSGNEPLGNQVRRLRQSRRRRCQAVVLFSADPSSRDSQTTLALLTTQGRTYESAAPRRSPWGQFVLRTTRLGRHCVLDSSSAWWISWRPALPSYGCNLSIGAIDLL
jgi:hypothetical protein